MKQRKNPIVRSEAAQLLHVENGGAIAMERFWLKSYPAGAPADVDIHEHRSLGAVFDKSVACFGSHPAFINMGKAITYSELDRLSRDFGAYLQSGLKLEPGARVAIMMPNLLQYPVVLFGILRSGYTVVNCNPLYTPRELEHQLQDSGAEAIVILENSAHTLAQIVANTAVEHVVTTEVGDLLPTPRRLAVNFLVKYVMRMTPAWRIPGAVAFRATMREGGRLPWKPAEMGPEKLALLQYTGGTTGVPKGAMLTHGNIIANLVQAHAWLKGVLTEGDETVVMPLPLYHVFALAVSLVLFKIGAANVLVTDPRDIKALIKELKRRPFTIIIGVNTLFNALVNHPDFASVDFSKLRLALASGMAVHRTVAEKWRKITGRPLIEAYGLTEASPCLASNPLDIKEFTGSLGLPMPSTEIAIRDESGNDLPVGQVGELCGRGPQIMKGYWRRSDETAKIMTPDGFLRTGDMAMFDERGFLHMVDRKKDVIIVSGFNVWPNEIEDVVALHPGVLEVGAVGVPDANSGETVRIVVVKKDPELSAEALIEHCRKYLTGYKVPRSVEFRTSLPHSNIGKILRRELRKPALTQ
jgi:long-chain acyl-CoA synthetase